MPSEPQPLRRSTDADLAVVVERLDQNALTLDCILAQTRATNGRVSELEVKERIRQDREEQAAMLKAAAVVATDRAERHAEYESEQDEIERAGRLSKRTILIAACIGASPGTLALAIAGATGHL